jgi:hypothetical protein
MPSATLGRACRTSPAHERPFGRSCAADARALTIAHDRKARRRDPGDRFRPAVGARDRFGQHRRRRGGVLRGRCAGEDRLGRAVRVHVEHDRRPEGKRCSGGQGLRWVRQSRELRADHGRGGQTPTWRTPHGRGRVRVMLRLSRGPVDEDLDRRRVLRPRRERQPEQEPGANHRELIQCVRRC